MIDTKECDIIPFKDPGFAMPIGLVGQSGQTQTEGRREKPAFTRMFNIMGRRILNNYLLRRVTK